MKKKRKERHAMALLRAHLYKQHEQHVLDYAPGPLPEHPTLGDLVLYCEQHRLLFDIHTPDNTPMRSLGVEIAHPDLTIGHIRAATPAEYVDWRK